MKKLSILIIGLIIVTLTSCENTAGNDIDSQNNISKIDSITDIEGNVYHTITIGTQTWMMENLKTTRYNDGTAITNISNPTDWMKAVTGAYCWYDQDDSNKDKYGALYNWYSVNTGKLAPTGWHIPTIEEWRVLSDYISTHSGTSGSIAKALASTTTDWNESTEEGTIGKDISLNNSSGFTALPGGCQANGASGSMGYSGNWWSTTESGNFGQYAQLRCNNTIIYFSTYIKYFGLSIRCIKD